MYSPTPTLLVTTQHNLEQIQIGTEIHLQLQLQIQVQVQI